MYFNAVNRDEGAEKQDFSAGAGFFCSAFALLTGVVQRESTCGSYIAKGAR